MKRTPLKSRQKPIKPTAIARSTTPIPKRRAKPRRDGVFRCRKFLNWLKMQRCFVTQMHGFPAAAVGKPHLHWKTGIVDPAHGPPAGLKVKGPDNEAIPLTRYYHEEQTALGWEVFELKYSFSRADAAKAYYDRFLLETRKS